MTVADYNTLLAAQGGVCAICGREEIVVHRGLDRVRNLAVDHCHTTGRVRGLLCTACNTMIACDDPEILRAGAKYVEEF